jgi:16S rRNA (cytosine1402-N4)-methyltransferase
VFDGAPEGRPHEPVLLAEVLESLALERSNVVADLTCGYDGHGAAIRERLGPEGRYIGIDFDREAIEYCQSRPRQDNTRAAWIQGSFARIREILAEIDIHRADRLFADLGVSSPVLDSPHRGMALRFPSAALDFRMSEEAAETAQELLARISEPELADILHRYGQERRARAVARALVRARTQRPISTVGEFAEIVRRALGRRKIGRIDSATRAAQAIRIYINRELENLERMLEQGIRLLTHNGRFVVISYHSLEDTLVKQAFRRASGVCTCPRHLPTCQCGAEQLGTVAFRGVIRPGPEEIRRNPRSRSARLRCFIRSAPPAASKEPFRGSKAKQ